MYRDDDEIIEIAGDTTPLDNLVFSSGFVVDSNYTLSTYTDGNGINHIKSEVLSDFTASSDQTISGDSIFSLMRVAYWYSVDSGTGITESTIYDPALDPYFSYNLPDIKIIAANPNGSESTRIVTSASTITASFNPSTVGFYGLTASRSNLDQNWITPDDIYKSSAATQVGTFEFFNDITATGTLEKSFNADQESNTLYGIIQDIFIMERNSATTIDIKAGTYVDIPISGEYTIGVTL